MTAIAILAVLSVALACALVAVLHALLRALDDAPPEDPKQAALARVVDGMDREARRRRVAARRG